MALLEKFYHTLRSVWDTPVLGSDAGSLIIALCILCFFLLIRGLFTKLILFKLSAITKRTKSSFDDHLFNALEKPISLVPIVLGLFIATIYLDPEGMLAKVIYNIEKSLIALAIFWALHNAVAPLSFTLEKLERVFSRPMVTWLRKGIRIIILFIGLATILQIWGIEVAPIIAGFGLFGVAVALGAQDMFKNLIGGLTIIAEKRFHPGDWIKIDGVVEGTVEDIGFRSTLIRRFDKAPVHVPNAQLADQAVTNFSAMTHRRIFWKIGVLYSSSTDQLKTIRDGIEDYVLNNDDFESPENVATFVRIDAFNASSIDIMLYCFTKTTNWGEWLAIKEQLAYHIKQVVEDAGSSFAFPSTSIYIENDGSDKPEAFTPPSKKPTKKLAKKPKPSSSK